VTSPGEVAAPPRSLLERLYPEERVAAVYFLAVAALLLGRGLPFTVARLAVDYLSFLGAIAAVTLPFWIGRQVVARRAGRFSLRTAGGELLGLARALAAFLVVLIPYTNLKSRLLQLHPRIFDAALAKLDAAIHFGGGDWLGWLLATNTNRVWLTTLAVAYFFAWAALALPFAVAFARGGVPAARRILLALGLAYVVGGFVYLAVPSLGPAFVERQRWAHLAGSLPLGVQDSMLAALRAIARDPSSPAVPFFGIAAFPSLHLATTSLGLFASWRWWKPLLVVLVPANLLIAWSALVWGWHYAVDFYPGVALAWGAWWAAGRMMNDGTIERSVAGAGAR